MSNSGGGRTKKRGRAMGLTLAGSPLVGRNMKRAGKSPGPSSSPKSAGPQGVTPALAIDESDIVLDRLEKEIVVLLQAGGSKKDAGRRRLRLGINEVTKFLEATAAAATSSSAKEPSSRSTAPAAIVLVCRDIRPPRLVEHLHALVSLTSTPHLVLSASSGSLGRIFGCKTMAALAICPPRCSAPPPRRPPPRNRPPPDPLSTTTNDGGAGTGGASTNARLARQTRSSNSSDRGRSGGSDGEDASARGVNADDDGADRKGDGEAGQGGQREPGEADASVGATEGADQGRGAREGGGAVPVGKDGEGRPSEGEDGETEADGAAGVASNLTAHVDEGVDSLVEFLRRKVRVP